MKRKVGRPKRRVRKSGELVTIYYDPFNNLQVEGEAHLISRIKKDKETEIWNVVFEDGHKCKRRIKYQNEGDESKMDKKSFDEIEIKENELYRVEYYAAGDIVASIFESGKNITRTKNGKFKCRTLMKKSVDCDKIFSITEV